MIVNSANHVGIGKQYIFTKKELADAEGCGVDDRDWLVGLCHKKGDKKLSMCCDLDGHGDMKSEMHTFGEHFYEYVDDQMLGRKERYSQSTGQPQRKIRRY